MIKANENIYHEIEPLPTNENGRGLSCFFTLNILAVFFDRLRLFFSERFWRFQLFLFFIAMAKDSSGLESKFRHFSVSNGLSSTTVYFVMQDQKGYMWFCTEAGVNRYDGQLFETFNIANHLADNENFRCFEDSQGRLWFSSYNGKLCYFHKGKFFTENEDSTLYYFKEAGKYLNNFIEDTAGNIWFSTFQGGIFRYDGKEVTAINKLNPCTLNPILFLQKAKIYSILENPKSNVLYSVTDKKSTMLKSKKGYGNIIGKASDLRFPGSTSLITGNGIEYLEGDSIKAEILNQQLNCKISTCCMVGNDLWIGSYRNGVFCLRDYKSKGAKGIREHYLDKESVSQIVTDKEGGIWISTLSDGVYYLSGTQSYIKNIPTTSVTSIKYNKNRGLWAAGTYYGELMIFRYDSLIGTFKKSTYPETRIKSLAWISDSKLLVGMDYSPYVFDIVTRKTANLELSRSGTSDLYEAKDGIWICARSAVYFLNKERRLRTMFENNIASTPISYKLVSVAGSDSDECWFASISSLFHRDSKGNIKEIAGQDLLGSNPIDIEYVNEYLWVATHGNGVFIFKNGNLIDHLTEHNSNLTSDVCQKLISDKKGNIWVATNKGVCVFDEKARKYRFRLTIDDVLISNDIKDLDFYDNNAYIATPTGISIISTEKIISSTAPPPVYVTILKVNDSNYTGTTRPNIPYFKGALNLGFTAITFQSNNSLNYRYKSASGDTGWHEISNGQVTFYNLAPGSYDFLISAKKYNSDWGQPISYGFTIMPLWYQSTFFKTICILLIASIIFIAFRLQIVRIRKRETEKTIYNKRIAELEGSALANQMNPHFIFNSLNTVQQFILQKEERQVLDYLSDFSLLMRQMLQYSRSSLIDLENEIDFLERYLNLEVTRFNGKFTYRMDIESGILDEGLKVPPMLIQPLLENAIKHGISAKGGQILLEIKLENDFLIVIVDDDGLGIEEVQFNTLSKHKIFESTALKVIESRLKLMRTKENRIGELNIINKRKLNKIQSGTIASLKIPLSN